MNQPKPVKEFSADFLKVKVFESDVDMGKAAAAFTAETLARAIEEKGSANLILATGASQFTFLDAFKNDTSVDWSKITVFHLDEYVGMSDQHPASFRKYLKERILDEVKPHAVHFLAGDAPDLQAVIDEYESLLKNHPVDIACIGIGENGHIAFNDPLISEFDEANWVKIADLDEACRKQQLGEGWFPTLDDVPRQALTLTIPAIMASAVISCVVPDERKAEAVAKTIKDPITNVCPATILRTHPDATLFLDRFSASLI